MQLPSSFSSEVQNVYQKYGHISCLAMQSLYTISNLKFLFHLASCKFQIISFLRVSGNTGIFHFQQSLIQNVFLLTGLPSEADSFAGFPICCHQGQGFCCHSWGCQEQLWSFAQQLSIKVHQHVQSRNQTFIVYTISKLMIFVFRHNLQRTHISVLNHTDQLFNW